MTEAGCPLGGRPNGWKRELETMKVWLKRIGVTVIVLGAAGFCAVLYRFPPAFFRVQEVVVLTRLKYLSEFDLIRLSGVKAGDNLLSLRLSKVREKILRFPWIRDVQLSKRVPGRLLIAVQEDEPVALVELDALFLANRDGEIFKRLGAKDPKNLPIITGLDRDDLKELKPLLGLVADFDATVELRALGLSEIRWARRGVSVFAGEPVVRIDLGKDHWNERLLRFARAWESIRTTSRSPKVVDVSFDKRIVVKQKL